MRTDELRAAFAGQARNCAALGSPFMGRLMTLCAERLEPDRPLLRALFELPGALGSEAASIPLRFAGALHAVRLDGDEGLGAVYPPAEPDDQTLWAAVSDALDRHAGRIEDILKSPPQTNEVGRAACLIATAGWLAARGRRQPLALSELGASAGLNLAFDAFALRTAAGRIGPADAVLTLTPEWRGETIAATADRVIVTDRRGVDLRPVDIATEAGRQRLLSYLWPDQPDRMARTRAAFSVANAAVDAGDAADWLDARLTVRRLGSLHLVYHTVAWQYFPQTVKDRIWRALLTAGSKASPDARLAWLGMEWDGADAGAGLTLRLWPGAEMWDLGRIDFHGRWLDWRPRRTDLLRPPGPTA